VVYVHIMKRRVNNKKPQVKKCVMLVFIKISSLQKSFNIKPIFCYKASFISYNFLLLLIFVFVQIVFSHFSLLGILCFYLLLFTTFYSIDFTKVYAYINVILLQKYTLPLRLLKFIPLMQMCCQIIRFM